MAMAHVNDTAAPAAATTCRLPVRALVEQAMAKDGRPQRPADGAAFAAAAARARAGHMPAAPRLQPQRRRRHRLPPPPRAATQALPDDPHGGARGRREPDDWPAPREPA